MKTSTKKIFLSKTKLSMFLVFISIILNNYLFNTSGEKIKLADTITTYPAEAQSCTVSWGSSGDTCVGGTEIGYYNSFQISGAYPGAPSTSGNIAFANSPGHCAAVGGNCYQYVLDFWSEYGTYETYNNTWTCYSGSTGVTPGGSQDSWSGYGSTDYDANIISCSGGNSAPNVPTLGGTNSIAVNTATANTVVATDPNGDQIFYEVDWDGNGTVDGTTGTFNSGVSASISHTYTAAGTYGVKARAVQANDTTKKSVWSAAYNITVTSGGGGGGSCVNYDNCYLGISQNCILFGSSQVPGLSCSPSDVANYCSIQYPGCGGGGGGTGCWSDPYTYRADYPNGCTEGGGTGCSWDGPSSFTPPIPSSSSCDFGGGNVANTPTCDGSIVTGGSVNTTTYPAGICFSGSSQGSDSYACGGQWIHEYSEYRVNNGTCSAPPSYNCESGQLNPNLSIVSNNSLIGVALNTGMRWFHNAFYGACYQNTSGANYFVPTKTQGEFNSFRDHLPPGVSKANGGW